MIDFLVLKVLSTYNAMIGWLFLRIAQAVVSTYYLKVKFLLDHRVREMSGYQVEVGECYFNSIRNQSR